LLFTVEKNMALPSLGLFVADTFRTQRKIAAIGKEMPFHLSNQWLHTGEILLRPVKKCIRG
ncbi:hypothetical protein RI665_31675, partial [Pseudomonas aeruginosa]